MTPAEMALIQVSFLEVDSPQNKTKQNKKNQKNKNETHRIPWDLRTDSKVKSTQAWKSHFCLIWVMEFMFR